MSKPTTFVVKGDQAELTATIYERVRNDADLIRVCQIDTTTWAVKKFTVQTQEMAGFPRAIGSKQEGWKRASTQPIITQMFHCKAWLERKTALITARAEIAAVIAAAERRIGKLRDARPMKRTAHGDHMLEVGIYDAHFGKLAWYLETGHGNYDLKIARADYAQALETVIDRTRHWKYEQVVFPIGNDLLNSDSRANQTTAGTPQDTDGRYHKAFEVVFGAMTMSIDRLRHIARVKVIGVGGNHDRESAWHLGFALRCYYRGQTDVTVDHAPTPRKYHQYGRNMLMLAHGDQGKRKNYPQIMASEQHEMWGATTHREIHCGHVHGEGVESFPGVTSRTLRALCSTDSWHAQQGYVGKPRGAEAFVWHKDEGPINHTFYTVPETKQKKGR